MSQEKMNKRQLRKKAFEVAAGLIDTMDLDQFWGDEVCDKYPEADLAVLQKIVVQHLSAKAGQP
jgi:hypothetical protein